MRNPIVLAFISVLAMGCASAPTFSQLNEGVSKVALVKNGVKPLRYSTGVIDTASFWAAHGSGVSSQLGGGTLWHDLEQSGHDDMASKALQNAAMVRKLFGDHELATKVNAALLPQLASLWNVAYDESSIIALSDAPAHLDPQTGVLSGIETDADLILLAEVSHLQLTERITMGGALKAGLTMGTHSKSLTTQVQVGLRAFKRETVDTPYKQVWFRLCGPDQVTMKTAYKLEELVESSEKMTEILDEATDQAVEMCTQTLASLVGRG